MEKVDNLLPGWTICTISDVIASDGVFVDGDWVESKDQDPDGDIRLIQLADIGDGYFQDKSARFLTKTKAIDLNCTFLQKGDLLVARMPDPLGRCCIFPLESNSGYVTVVDVCVIRAGTSSIDHKFLMYLINSPEIRTQISSLQSGSTRKRISRKNLATVALPIAPLNEQRRIVAKIEELFSELDKGTESLKTAREQLKIYRQAVLKHAFEGKLTAQWREEHKDKLESPEQLLARIQQEREARYQQQLTDWQAALKTWEQNGKDGKKPGKPKTAVILNPVSKEELANSSILPNNWAYIRLGEIIDEPSYGTSKKCDYEFQGLGVLRIPNISEGGRIDSSDLKFAEFQKEEIESYKLQPGDILTIRSNGSISLVGQCALITEKELKYLYAGYLIRLRPDQKVVDPEYLLFVLSSHFLRSQIESAAKSTSGVNNINAKEIQNLVIPMAGKDEQKVLMDHLAQIIPSITATEEEIKRQLLRAETLRQSILKKAFSGQLVPQDPNDEPAAVLCDRIRAAKAAQPKPSKKPRQSKTTSSPRWSGETPP